MLKVGTEQVRLSAVVAWLKLGLAHQHAYIVKTILFLILKYYLYIKE